MEAGVESSDVSRNEVLIKMNKAMSDLAQ